MIRLDVPCVNSSTVIRQRLQVFHFVDELRYKVCFEETSFPLVAKAQTTGATNSGRMNGKASHIDGILSFLIILPFVLESIYDLGHFSGLWIHQAALVQTDTSKGYSKNCNALCLAEFVKETCC